MTEQHAYLVRRTVVLSKVIWASSRQEALDAFSEVDARTESRTMARVIRDSERHHEDGAREH